MSLEEAFYALTPDRILDAVEVGGRRATGYVLPLNSLENRVYEIEYEDGERLVAKFYRPARWSRDALADEHLFLAELLAEDVPVVPAIALDAAGNTIGELPVDGGTLYFALFQKARGRVPEELFDPQIEQIGRVLARLHHVGTQHRAPHRPTLDVATYGRASLELLRKKNVIPAELTRDYESTCEKIFALCEPALAKTPTIRTHGDCHLGNLVWGTHGAFFLDFDDFLHAAPVQDMWLLLPGRDQESRAQRELLIESYELMRPFDRSTMRLIEPLRALRIIRYAAWIASRYQDPAFQRAFSDFDSFNWWQKELQAVKECEAYVQQALA